MNTTVPVLVAPPGYCRTSSVADDLWVTPGTVRRWIRQQRLRAEKFHGTYLIDVEELRRFRQNYTNKNKPWAWVESVLKDVLPDGFEYL
jgi:excisionase family DNA binding protein